MISAEAIANKILSLPPSSQKEVLDHVNRLLDKPAELSTSERIAAWKDWVNRNATPGIVVDDSREAIYQD